MADHSIDFSRCPVTGELRLRSDGFSWTDHSRPGVYNSCERCNPDGPSSPAALLRETEAKRRAEA